MGITAEQILAARDLGELERVSVPAWGGDVFIRPMTAGERDGWEAMIGEAALERQEARESGKPPPQANVRASFLVRVLCDESGERIFSDEQAGEFSGKNSAILDDLYTRARRLSRVTENDLEEMEKNFEGGPEGDS